MFRALLSVTVLVAFSALPALAQDIQAEKVERVKLRVNDATDRFNGARTISATRTLNLDKTGLLTTVSLNPAILVPDGGAPIFYAVVSYTGYGWAFMNGHAEFLVDGRRFSAHGRGSAGNREVATCSGGAGCLVGEVQRILIDRDLAQALATASEAEIRIRGDRGALTGRLDERHVAYFREMVRRYSDLGGTYLATGELAPDTAATSEGDATAAPDRAEVAAPSLQGEETPTFQQERSPTELDPAKRCDACGTLRVPQ